MLGVDPAVDVDTLRLVFAARDPGQPLVLLHGRFDRNRFAVGTGHLEEIKQDGFRLYRDTADGRDTTLALAGDTLVVSLDRQRVLAALRQAAGPTATMLANERLKGLLKKVDRQAALWLAVDFDALGRPKTPEDAMLLPIFEQSATVSGELTCGTEWRLKLIFQGRGTKQPTNSINICMDWW